MGVELNMTLTNSMCMNQIQIKLTKDLMHPYFDII